MSAPLKEAREHWQAIEPLLTIRTEQDYAAAIERLRELPTADRLTLRK